MFVFWRFTIAFLAISSSIIISFYLIKMSVYDISFADNLPSKGISDIPPADTILPSIFAKIQSPPPSSSLPAPTPTTSTTSTTPTPQTTQTPKSAPTAPTSQTPKSAKSVQSLPTQSPQSLQSSLYFQDVSSQQCFDYAKNCRDVQCAFEDFSVICDNKGNGPTCTCGTGQTSNASSSIRSNAHFAILTIFISFIISFY